MTSATPPSTALSVTSTNCAIETTPKTDCSNSADIGIGLCSTRRILSSSLHRIRNCYRFIMKIDMERYNKAKMPLNAEKHFMTHP